MTGLERIYRGYLDALNERRFDDLDRFVHDEVIYNDGAISRDRYAAQRRAEAATIPDLHYHVQHLVVDGDQVACRLWFDCTPQRTFLGIEPNGRRASFAEHVFYRFSDRRIAQVWSLLDVDAIRRQLTS
jgi:predicted ester cyclase